MLDNPPPGLAGVGGGPGNERNRGYRTWKTEIRVGDPEELPEAEEPVDNDLAQLDRHRGLLYRYFVSKLRRYRDIEDLVQDVYTRYLQRYRSKVPVRSSKALCLKIAHDVMVDTVRKPKRTMVEFDAEVVELVDNQGVRRDEPFERLAALEQVELTIAGFNDNEYKLAYFDRWAEKSNEEIAIELGISSAVVRQRKTRLNKRLMDIEKKEG
jgi:RNA polymerase sigma factor (sigma-70 family)